ncbi:peptidase, M24 family [Ancylostoma ceylanicum]|uniref:Xaa-Pro dipeptidase n=1 Tax=Ancylostoma ceylanicum TaxID=53326 RepID=A0A0D6LTN1_9BILA|nr:peptidase, M24 family [Ancylostoma ceylanicum]
MSFSRGANTLRVSAKLFAENRSRLVAALKESYFFWAFGVHESDFFGAIDVDSGKSCLFAPTLDPSYAIWDGKINDENWFKNKYEVDDVHFNKDKVISDYLLKHNAKKLLLLRAENTDSGNVLEPATFEGKELFNVDTELLYPIIAELRVFKTDRELQVMRYACKIASEAHRATMKAIRAGLYEYQMESGCNGSILHYGHANAPNEKQIKDGDMCLFDMGPEYNCYASDVTTSFPANGKFTEKQKMVYNAVLDANLSVFKSAKPGEVEEMLAARIGAVFMPHGLGHFLGLDVHDCGGYLGVITIEPGCYFIDTLLDAAFKNPDQAKFLVKEEIDKYRGEGGVRIEDDVVIWESGNENMNCVPRTVKEIEEFMASEVVNDSTIQKRIADYLKNH